MASMDLLSRLGSELASSPAEAAISRALRTILDHFRADMGTIHALDPQDGMLHLRAYSEGIPAEILAVTRVIPVGKGMAGLAVERREPISVCNLQADLSGVARPGAKATGAQGALCVPILLEDKAIGALGIGFRHEREFTDEETRLLLEAGRMLAPHLGKG